MVAFPVGLALTLQAGLALADSGSGSGSGSRGNHPGHHHHSHTKSIPPTDQPTEPPITIFPSTTPPTDPTKPPPTTRPPTSTSPPAPTTKSPTSTKPPPASPFPSPSPTRSSTSPSPSPARSYGVGITRQITIDPTTGRGSISFTVGNTTGKVQPARDVYAFSTNQLEILAVQGCAAAPPIAQGRRDSFRCTLPSLRPGETRTWTADIRYLPATRPGGAQAGRAAPLVVPLVDESDISTFTVVVVPQGATNLRVVLGQDGPLRLAFGSNDPNVIGFTVRPGEGSGTTAAANVRTPAPAGPNPGTDAPAANSNGGNTPNTPTALPKTGLVPWNLSMAGGALGLLILGTALVHLARRRTHPSPTA
ncbi:hypothetical protein [Yinghuangia sp. YIM S09857]|uniref:hypothetical protein n=1 Tax=Yinghuangia sp. YIM S09857 TaxID=3436929 RepID=UPI003F52C7EE